MTLSAEDRRYILINTAVEQERVFTVLERICAGDADKVQFLGEIEAALKKCVRSFEVTQPIANGESRAGRRSALIS